MTEDAIETEGRDAMTCLAIDERSGMAAGLTGRRDTMAGIAPVTHHIRARVVREGALKTVSRMAGTTFGVGIRVWWRGRLAVGNHAVVATRA